MFDEQGNDAIPVVCSHAMHEAGEDDAEGSPGNVLVNYDCLPTS